MRSPRVAIVIPCFNEHERLDATAVGELLADPAVHVSLVDDGSTDRTGELLDAIAARHLGRVVVLRLPANVGKGEATRAGLRSAIADGADIVAYADADFATPPAELRRLVDIVDDGDVDGALGSRISRLGSTIDRSAVRHVIGRVFATVVGVALSAPVYDSQCGAKAFRTTTSFRQAIDIPFTSRWAFDVELLDRLLHSDAAVTIVEVPLLRWTDRGGSKLTAWSAGRAVLDVIAVGVRRRLRRRRDRAAAG